jgi:hypothetical protein
MEPAIREEKNGSGTQVAEKLGGGDDGVVYLGRNSFKMKVGVQITPPVGLTPPAGNPTVSVVTPTPVPVLTLPPLAKPPRIRRLSEPRSPATPAVPPDAGWRTKAVVGLCLIAFSCGLMTFVAIDRFWPRARAQCLPADTAGVASPTPVLEAERPSAAVGSVAEVAPPPSAAPPSRAAQIPAPAAPPVEPVPVPRPAPAARPAAAVRPAPAVLPMPAARPIPAAREVRGVAPAPRAPAPRPLARGRAAVRTRPSAGRSDVMAPTESWSDPFAE